MKDDQFTLHARIEDTHWWFVARRRIILKLAHALLPQTAPSTIVDVGCGTGANIGAFADRHNCSGIDLSEKAIQIAAQRFPTVNFQVGNALSDTCTELLRAADCVLLLDVIEHVPDDFEVVSHVLSKMKPGAILIVTVPADLTLWSPHDVHLAHYRRYDLDRLQRLWEDFPVTCRLISHFNARLYPFIKFVRRLTNLWRRPVGHSGTDLFQVPKLLSKTLCWVMHGECSRLLRALQGDGSKRFRFGVSLVAVLQRNAGEITVRTRPSDVAPDMNRELCLRDENQKQSSQRE